MSKNKHTDYEGFVEKFKPKLTTDDCITPSEIYEVVKAWAAAEYGLEGREIVRPFWPGADYQSMEYPAGCVVLDNPPFSILTRICEWYLERGIDFFLFAPCLTALAGRKTWDKMNHICVGASVVYENGAAVNTSFVTNLGGGGTIAQTAPELRKLVDDASEKLRKQKTVELPKYAYPDHVVTAALLQKWGKYGVDWRIKRGDCVQISALDAQRETGKAVFGSGLLLSERAAAERAAAERAAATRWALSEREMSIVRSLGGGDGV